MRIRTEGVAWQEIDGELVILDLQSSSYLKTNSTGAVLARALEQDQGNEDLTAILMKEFGVDAEAARRDAAAFVAQLSEFGLLS